MNILCWLGFHEWLYQHPKTRLYLHTFIPTDSRDFVINWTKRRCDWCGKEEGKIINNET